MRARDRWLIAGVLLELGCIRLAAQAVVALGGIIGASHVWADRKCDSASPEPFDLDPDRDGSFADERVLTPRCAGLGSGPAARRTG